MLDIALRRIVPKAAGTYFIVRDNSQVEEIENENKMRLMFINVEQGPINMAVSFAKGDTTGFQSTFGKGNRMMKKKGNFSIDTCIDALSAGPITVVNLRSFDDELDKCEVCGMNMNKNKILVNTVEATYRELFNTSGFWTPNYNQMNEIVENCLLNFGNIGNSDISIFVVRSNNVDTVTSEGNRTLAECSMAIEEYPAIDFGTLVKDTIVDVYLFDNTFDPETVTTNKFYGHLFNNNGQIDYSRLEELCTITEAGFVKMFTGSVIPSLVSENGYDISINTVINQYFMQTGLICDINEEEFEKEYATTEKFIDANAYGCYNTNEITLESFLKRLDDSNGNMISHVLPEQLTICKDIPWEPTTDEENSIPDSAHSYIYHIGKIEAESNSFYTSFEQGIRLNDYIIGTTRIVQVSSIEVISEHTGQTDDFNGYTKVKVSCDGPVKFDYSALSEDGDGRPVVKSNTICKLADITNNGYIMPFNMTGCKVRANQFIDGTASRQSEILDMMIDPGIVKGLKQVSGLRYVVDCFKSYVESGYKYQYGQLMKSLDEKNCFVRAILNEPSITDLQKSTNPLFRQYPKGPFQLSYLETGGNQVYSSKLLSKFTDGAEFCFFYWGHDLQGGIIPHPLAGKVSNLYYGKTNAWDVVANTSGYLDGVQELEYDFDDEDRMYLEHFLSNPIIKIGSNITIFGNYSAQKVKSAQQQAHNSDLLAYIKESLYSMSRSEAFKKGNYDDYLRTETEAKDFMNSLALAGAIDADPIVICNQSNNTLEIRKQKIKLVHIEYTPVDCLDKIVFDLTIN